MKDFVRLLSTWRDALLIFIVASIAGGACAQQKESADPVAEYNKAVAAVQNQRWDEALASTNAVISEHGAEALEKFGPVFGHFFFIKGLALQGKEDHAGALAAFKTCYEKYNNKAFDALSNEAKQGKQRNNFVNSAHVQWANTEMKLENFVVARDLFEKILVEAETDPAVNKIYIAVNLGRCYLRAGDLEKGFEFMERPLSNNSLSDGLRETIFMIIAEDWSPEVEYPKVREFLQTYGDVVDQDPFQERYERNPRFLYLAQLALSAQDPVMALAWYERMVNPLHLKPEFQRRYQQLENRVVSEALKERKAETLAQLKSNEERLGTDYIQILNGVGSVHFMLQNFGGSYVAFSQLSDMTEGGQHDQRPVFLHNAVVSAAQTEQWKEAYHYGKQFLAEFPTHELKPGVARVLVDLLFLREEYEEAYKISGEVRQDMDEGEAVREVPDFVRGASAFQLGYVEEAETELSTYFKIYPEGERVELAQFFFGLAKLQLAKWADAAEIFNQFLESYPDSEMVPTVLYQCGLCEFMIDELDSAYAKVDRVVTEFPSLEVAPPSWNLKGDILTTQEGDLAEIETCYLAGRDGGKKLGQPETAAYALWQLVVLNVDQEVWEQADEHYVDFRDNYPDSEYRHDLLVASLPMLVERGRKEEGLEKLQDVVWQNRSDPDSTVLAEMFGSYVEFIKDEFGNDFLIERMSQLREQRGMTPTLQGWLTMAKADALEAKEASKEEIDKEYYLLEAGFDPSVQSNYTIVRLARWIR
ncbi:MAG: tetratricopeptide repeat protein, partial [Verrucomicrobiota bacterium]